MSPRYDQSSRERIDKALQLRAAIGGNLFSLMMIIGAWAHGDNVWAVVGICVTYAVYSALLGKRVTGMMDRRLANVGFCVGNTLQALALMWVAGFAPYSLVAVPAVIVFYDIFGEGDLRPFVVGKLFVLGGAAVLGGADPSLVAAAVTLGGLVHWMSEGRGETLRAVVAEVKTQAQELRAANEQMQELNAKLDARGVELQTNLEQLRAAQDKLLQSEKLAAIGQLAAGVAHEINNPLAVILGFANGLERRVEASSPLRQPVASIVRESLRCKSLVQELLVFSRTAKPGRERVEPSELMRRTGQLLEARARTQGTSLTLEVADVPELSASGTQLQQVIINLGNNAMDAIGKGGEVVLRSRRAGDEVCIEVQDTGPGIPQAIRAKIFEPFFTTKEVGKGTGLGLSLVYEIVQQHGGSIEVESEEGQGTLMRVRLPIEASGVVTEGRAAA